MKSQIKRNILLLPIFLIISLAVSGMAQAQSDLKLEFITYPESVTTNQLKEIVVKLTDSEGEPVPDKEITFSTDSGSLDTKSAVTNQDGEASVYFTAPGEYGTSKITAKVDGTSETIEIETEMSLFQIIVLIITCLLGMFGVGGGTAYYLRRAKKAREEE